MSTVLVVDDVELNRIVIGRQLKALGLHVIEATNGHEGLQAYLHYPASIACIFLDLMMPVLDGFNAALSIRSEESRHGWVPVPIVAYTSEDVRHGSPTFQKCLDSGFNDVVPKPMNRRHAMQLLARWVPGIKERQAAAGGSSSCASSDNEAQCSCESEDQGGASLCRQCSLSSFAAAAAQRSEQRSEAATYARAQHQHSGAGDNQGISYSSGGSGDDSTAPQSGGGASDTGGADGSSASSGRRAAPLLP